VLSTTGTPTIGAPNTFFVNASKVVNQRPGLLFWGTSRKTAPFKGGTPCVRAPLVRTPTQSSGGNPPPDDCSGSFSFHFSDTYALGQGLLPGDRVYAQCFYVDQGLWKGAGLSDAVTFPLLP
jgi:hypothetical protein